MVGMSGTVDFRLAEVLNDQRMAFAAGIILLAAVDAIGFYSVIYNGSSARIKSVLMQLNGVVDYPDPDYLAQRIRECFRNGLIHEGRIKKGCQFSYEHYEMI